MAPPRKCNCDRDECFTCHTRRIRQRWVAKQARRRAKVSDAEVSDAELDRRAIAMDRR